MKARAKNAPSAEQLTASDPVQNIWVNANAGTGKTSVLVQRLLRILFRINNDKSSILNSQSSILCLTYTNAGAGEMRNRILAKLREWAGTNDAELRDLLYDIAHNKPPTDEDVAVARAIFYKYIDNNNILKIRTIHGFCEEVLRRFPIEAGISPSWKLISGADQKQLLRETFQDLINHSSANTAVSAAFTQILSGLSEHSLDDLLSILSDEYRRFFNINKDAQVIDTTKDFLEIGTRASDAFYAPNSVFFRKKLSDEIFDELKIAKSGLKTLGGILDGLNQFKNKLDTPFSDKDFDDYKIIFLTGEGNIREFIKKRAYIMPEAELVYELNQEIINKNIFKNSEAMYTLANAFAQKYQDTKRTRGLLDFDDLILYTNQLFANPSMMGWVLSQLDNNISHILVDEAQDTSPEQWEILQNMTTNFFNDQSVQNPQALFVVGDTKQSIFSFQGADPDGFKASKDQITSQIKNDMHKIQDVSLDVSYRTVAPILSAVDYFFNAVSITYPGKFTNNKHKSFRADAKGLLEVHPLSKPLENQGTASARGDYITKISEKIKDLLENGFLESENRKIVPSDIMILVQRRNPYAPMLIDELQRRGIQVAGSDRIKLPEFPAIRDLLYLARWALQPDEDFYLSCVLKGPVFRLSEHELFNLCHGRKGDLFARIKDLHPDMHDALEAVKSHITLAPYSFFMKILSLNDDCLAQNKSETNSNHEPRPRTTNHDYRARIISAMGPQAIDPLEEFLTICLSYERTYSGGMQKFIKWFTDGGSEIVREVDKSAGIRIVTTHGSKGLEANIIMLVDTMRTPSTPGGSKITAPIWHKHQNGNAFLWKGKIDKSDKFMQCEADESDKALAEYFRLLYVAMTRPRDRLYIFGFDYKKEASAHAWHTNLYRVLESHPDATITNDGIITIKN